MTAALCLYAAGITAFVVCHGWWRNPTDHLTRTLSFIRSAASHLFSNKGKRA